MVKLADDWPIVHKASGIRAWSINGFVEAELDRTRSVEFFEDVDFIETAARVLDLRPAQLDVAFRSEYDCTLLVCGRCRRHAAAHEALSDDKKQTVWFASLFVFRDLAAEWI